MCIFATSNKDMKKSNFMLKPNYGKQSRFCTVYCLHGDKKKCPAIAGLGGLWETTKH